MSYPSLTHLPLPLILKVNNRSFCHASPCLRNQLPNEFGLPADHEYLSLSSDLTHISSSFASPLSPSITSSDFHSRLKTHLFHNPFSIVLLPFHRSMSGLPNVFWCILGTHFHLFECLNDEEFPVFFSVFPLCLVLQ